MKGKVSCEELAAAFDLIISEIETHSEDLKRHKADAVLQDLKIWIITLKKLKEKTE